MSSEEDLALLRAVRDWRPPSTLHPIAMEAWNLYAANGNQLPPEVIDQLRARLEDYGKRGADLLGLGAAIEGLARFIILLGHIVEDQPSSLKVAAMVREFAPRFEPFWQRVGLAMANLRSDARVSFLEFADREHDADRQAPVYGKPAPVGAIPLRTLAPVVRPPPWIGRKPKQKQKQSRG